MKLKSKINSLKDEVIYLRRDFHQYPELGWNEFRTSEKISQYLNDIGLEVNIVASTGVMGLLRGKAKGPTLLMRADMDALPIQEMNEVSYKSVNPGVMHACGHDGHMAMLMVTAKILSEYKDKIHGNIKFVFQPNEESAEGSKAMIRDGILENPRVDKAMGMHLWSQLGSGLIGIKTGAVMASLSTFKINIIGKGGHTGYPEYAIDPIIAAADMIQQVQLIQTRETSQLNPIIIMFGKIKGGKKNNIIPDCVEIEGTLRYLNQTGNQEFMNPKERIKELIHLVAQIHRVKVVIDLIEKNKMVVNCPDMVEIIRTSAKSVVGDKNIVDFVSTASEDFSEFSHYVPSVFYFLGCGHKEIKNRVSHHNCYFNIDEEVLPVGIEIQVHSALNFFK